MQVVLILYIDKLQHQIQLIARLQLVSPFLLNELKKKYQIKEKKNNN